MLASWKIMFPFSLSHYPSTLGSVGVPKGSRSIGFGGGEAFLAFCLLYLFCDLVRLISDLMDFEFDNFSTLVVNCCCHLTSWLFLVYLAFLCVSSQEPLPPQIQPLDFWCASGEWGLLARESQRWAPHSRGNSMSFHGPAIVGSSQWLV